jgi:hypothetical protein
VKLEGRKAKQKSAWHVLIERSGFRKQAPACNAAWAIYVKRPGFVLIRKHPFVVSSRLALKIKVLEK